MRFALLGPGQPDLTETAAAVVADVGGTWAAPEHWTGAVAAGRAGGRLRGLYAGGTLCDEAMLLATARVGRVASNIPLDPGWALAEDLASVGDTMIDFGDDRLTRGRPHPMIDGSVRAQRVLAEVADPTCGVLLLDVVLGLGAADDPAGELVDPVRAATDGRRARGGGGGRHRRRPAGAARAGRRAAPGRRLGVPVQRGRRPVRPRPAGGPRMSLTTPRTVVTAGASMFADALVRQAVDVVPVDWQPPVVDPARLAAVMADPRRPGANARRWRRCSVRRRTWSTYARRRRCSGWSGAGCCTPVPRSTGSAPPGRCAER